MTMRCSLALRLAFLLLLAISVPPSLAQEEAADLGWTISADLSYVQTTGNAEARTLGLAGVADHRWPEATAHLELGGIRAEAAEGTRRAVGTPDDFRIVRPELRPTAEKYHLRGRYDRKLDEQLFWYAGAGWERNRFAGIDSRLVGLAGAGIERQAELAKLRLAAAATLTQQDEVVDDPTSDDTFAGARLEAGYERSFGSEEGPRWTSSLTVDENLQETEDLRAALATSLTFALVDRLSFKTTIALDYDNLPAREAVPLFPPGSGEAAGTVLVELEELDSSLTVALVVDLTP